MNPKINYYGSNPTKKKKTVENNNSSKPKNAYTLKPPLKVKCMECENELTILFCPPRQCYSHKNNWGWWTQRSENEGKYRCDDCIIDMYNNRKFEYLSEITDSKKRGRLRSYLYNKIVES